MWDDPDHRLPRRKPRRWPVWTGVVVTSGWLTFLALYLWNTREVFWTLPPNEVGDFLAGAFAPLAFLWLVLGFFQQGEELRHSADALWLQGEELRNSVEAQRKLVDATKEQVALDHRRNEEDFADRIASVQPIFAVTHLQSRKQPTGKKIHFFELLNSGSRCSNLVIDFLDIDYDEGDLEYDTLPILETSQKHTFSIITPPDDEILSFVIGYTDARGVSRSWSFLFHHDQSHSFVESLGRDVEPPK